MTAFIVAARERAALDNLLPIPAIKKQLPVEELTLSNIFIAYLSLSWKCESLPGLQLTERFIRYIRQGSKISI